MPGFVVFVEPGEVAGYGEHNFWSSVRHRLANPDREDGVEATDQGIPREH